jgi:hypothetical protein
MKNLDGSGRALIGIFQCLLEGSDVNHKYNILVTIGGVSTENRTEHLQEACLQRYSYTNIFGVFYLGFFFVTDKYNNNVITDESHLDTSMCHYTSISSEGCCVYSSRSIFPTSEITITMRSRCRIIRV